MCSSVERIDNPHVAADIAIVGEEINSMFQSKQQAAMDGILNGASVGYNFRQYPLDNLTMLEGSNRAAPQFEGFERNGSERSDQEGNESTEKDNIK
ncbi:hypothetical protein G6F26_002424 [Rhizopus arrhizus]|nr:hypothetical protein G6F18_002183 [Rhizopus arrhizus]KAG0855678.1 hypothetical protein G6F17_005254 [Rhizopus arrhizus]KAG0942984.1 hypothetical protein G6F30_005462 [Rhizopus arrhizus]KAG0953380.1 hypothetical protein G6F32_004227 [Rhizopus arrhizus]KAG1010956.1 hypothetical protein G6F27_004175 [Rhizopus arrhizus]